MHDLDLGDIDGDDDATGWDGRLCGEGDGGVVLFHVSKIAGWKHSSWSLPCATLGATFAHPRLVLSKLRGDRPTAQSDRATCLPLE